jgi:hypothetical protein
LNLFRIDENEECSYFVLMSIDAVGRISALELVRGRPMIDDEWLPEIEPPSSRRVVEMDRRPLSERPRLSDRGLVDFRRVCDHIGILDPESDAIRRTPGKK